MGSEPNRMRAIIKDPQHIKRVVESVQVFYLRQDFMDLCFVCARGHRVFAHKLLLSSVSSQLKQMFLEIPDGIDVITIHLPDVEARILRLLMEFLYEGGLRLGSEADYEAFNNVQELLGIVLHRSTPNKTTILHQAESLPTAQTIPPQAVFCMQAPGPNNQGQMQYVIAAPANLPQGQVIQMAQGAFTKAAASSQMMQVNQTATPGQMMQVAQAQTPSQVMQIAPPNTSMPQGQIMQMSPAMMSQANGQMVQVGPSISMQQNNLMQVVPQSNGQVMPMVMGNQMVQCSSQLMVQAGQQPSTMINNNQIQTNNQNQTPQPNQRPQYVMTSTANQITTNRTQMQYTQPQITPPQRIVARSRTTTQVAQPARNNAVTNVRTRRLMRAPVPMAQNRSNNASRISQRSRHTQ